MLDEKKRERIAKLAKMRLLDDDLMKAVFRDNIEAAQLVIRIILDNDALIVTNVRVEDAVPNVRGRSVRLDVSAVDSKGNRYDIEIQRADKGAGTHRARYNSALTDADMLRASTDFEKDLKDSYVIFITEGDPLGKDLPLYHVERVVMETKELFEDGSHIIYANSNIQDETKLGKLMHDFWCTDPQEMYYEPLADRMHDLKNTEKGAEYMCRIMEQEYQDGRKDGLKEGRQEGREEGILAMVKELQNCSFSQEKIMSSIMRQFHLSYDEARTKVQKYWIS